MKRVLEYFAVVLFVVSMLLVAWQNNLQEDHLNNLTSLAYLQFETSVELRAEIQELRQGVDHSTNP